MTLIPWGRIAALVAVLAALGWIAWAIRDSGKDAGLAAGEQQRAALASELIHERTQASTCAATLERINDETARGVAEAEERARAAEGAALIADKAAKDAEAEAAKALVALTASKRTPTCRAQLEMPLCDAIPLL